MTQPQTNRNSRAAMRLPALAAIAAAMALGACSSIDCPMENTVYTAYGLYKAAGVRDTLTDTLTVSTARSNRTDSILLNRSTNTSVFELPMSYTAPADTLVFTIADTLGRTVRDTLWIDKENYPHFESVDCNISFFHYITGVRWAGHAIDSVAVNKQHVDYDASTEHFHIYLKARR